MIDHDRRTVPLTLVHADPSLNVSREGQPITDADAAELAADIAAHGQTDPVGVVPLERALWLTHDEIAALDAERVAFLLIYGFRRHRACTLLCAQNERTTIRIDVLDRPFDRGAAELANLAENWGHKPPTEYQLTWAVHRMVIVRRVDPKLVALRTRHKIAWVHDAVSIVERVDPDLLQWYRANSAPEVRRRMLALASIDGVSTTVRYRLQQDQWAAWDRAEAIVRRADPQGGIAPRGPDRRARAARDLRGRVRTILDGPAPDGAKIAAIRTLVED